MTLSIANHHGSLPIAYRLYLPRAWTDDKPRRTKAHVPPSVRFKTKPQIALEQIRAALKAGIAPGVVLMDASYGTNSPLRQAITELGLCYVAAIISTVKVRQMCEDKPKPRRISVATLARSLPKHARRTIMWREGSNARLRSRFARVCVHVAPMQGEARFAEETLLIECPRTKLHPRNSGSRPSIATCRFPPWSTSPSCAGASSATIRNSSRKSASAITRAAPGGASIITARCRLRADYITAELALKWATQPAHAQPAQWANRLGMVRRFARYCLPNAAT